jgi:DNA (cytosine-5)-methyltransferase 1
MTNHKQKLLEIYALSSTITDIKNIDAKIETHINEIGQKIASQKGVFTVLVTLITHKILYPKQDIRYHQSSMKHGFSGRTIDTKYITPTLKELKLPSMAESGWLTRSLEQPYPYTLKYNGKISNKTVRTAFLNIIDYVEKNPKKAKNILRSLLNEAIQAKQRLAVPIIPLTNPENITIQDVIDSLAQHFDTKYNVHGGSKLPVIALYAIYQILIDEIKRYEDCELAELGSHTASDRTSNSSGDIEILKNKINFEAVEIKLDKVIDSNIVRIAIEKIHKFNLLERYYILSHIGIKEEDREEIQKLIIETKAQHGCQIILNGVLSTIKYYLRLIGDTEEFVRKYSALVENDSELKRIHKTSWNNIIKNDLNV